MNRTELIAKVREHALANYEQGWDVVVETYTDDEIATVIGKVRTAEKAIELMAANIEPYNERRREIEALADDDDYDPQMGTWSPVLDKPSVPKTYIQDIATAERQAHRIAEAIATGTRSAEHHASIFPSWEMITTESGAFFTPDNDVVRRHLLDQKGALAQYLSGHAGFVNDLDLAISFYRDQAFVIRLMELELKRREQEAEKDRLVEVGRQAEEHTRYPRNTETGPVCGNCTHYDGTGDRVILRHATTHDIRDCYAARYNEEQAILGEIEAEKRVERHFEERF